MTKLLKPVIRETAVFDRAARIVVELHPRYLELRLKGDRTGGLPLRISIEGLYQQLCRNRAEEQRRDNARSRSLRRSA